MSNANIAVQPDTRSRAYAIAAQAGVDYRPVLIWLRGGALPRGTIGEKILLAAKALDIAPLSPEPST